MIKKSIKLSTILVFASKIPNQLQGLAQFFEIAVQHYMAIYYNLGL